eukprot:m.355995 g.355995  ORF g.355995 m.355995 type:complete len:81 (-) comp17411_c0_seq1:210-452(-)
MQLLLQKVNADGFLVCLCEDALAVALNHGGLANSTVPYNEDLDSMLNFIRHVDDVSGKRLYTSTIHSSKSFHATKAPQQI